MALKRGFTDIGGEGFGSRSTALIPLYELHVEANKSLTSCIQIAI